MEVDLRAQLARSADREAKLRAELLQNQRSETTLQDRLTELEWQLAEQAGAANRARLELDRYRETTEQKLSELQHSAGRTDDLKRIRGVGPRFEAALHAAGVRTFEQIAAWTDADLEAMAPRLKVRAERIRRDRWIELARELMASSPAGSAVPTRPVAD